MPDGGVLVCPECDRHQTEFQTFLERHAGWVGAVKLVATLIAVPILLWLLTVWQDDRAKKRTFAEARFAEVGAALPEIRHSQALLYEACLGVQGEACAERVQDALSEYLKAENVLSGTIGSYFPELTPTTQLLASLNSRVSNDVSYLWNFYLVCLKAEETDNYPQEPDSVERAQYCADWRRSSPIEGLAVSNFLVEFLDCKGHVPSSGVRSGSLISVR